MIRSNGASLTRPSDRCRHSLRGRLTERHQCARAGASLSANSIARVIERPNVPGVDDILLARPNSARDWTTTTDVGGADPVSCALIPASANGDNYVGAVDILDLIDCLNGQMWCCFYGLYSTDVDHSEHFAPADLLTRVDLLNGARTLAPWYGKSLPTDSSLGGSMMAGGGPSLGEMTAEGPFDSDSENAHVADWFVAYLEMVNPTDSAKLEEFQIVVDSLTDWCVDHFTADEKNALVGRLNESMLGFASHAGAKTAASVIGSLKK